MARNGDVEIWTSTYTLAEVFKRKCDKVQTGLDEEKDIIFEDFLDQDFVVYAQVDADVGKIACRLLRRHPELKKPPDAIHLATAVIHNCDEFHTADEDNPLPLNGRIVRLDKANLLICKPPEPPPGHPGIRRACLANALTLTICLTMPARKPRDPNEKSFSERFEEMAKELGCDEDLDAFKEKLGQIARNKPKDQPKNPETSQPK
jgi:hypothetical protein